MDVSKKFGYRLQRIRLTKSITQEQLANKIQKTTHYISDLENGKRKPNLNTLLDLIAALEITPNELFCDFFEVVDKDTTEMIQLMSEIPLEYRPFYLDFLRNYKKMLNIRKK